MWFQRAALPLLAGLALAGCASEAELREAQQAQAEADRFACLEQGFEQQSENLALCRLILQTNRRLDELASRIRFLENDVQRLNLWDFPGRSRRCC